MTACRNCFRAEWNWSTTWSDTSTSTASASWLASDSLITPSLCIDKSLAKLVPWWLFMESSAWRVAETIGPTSAMFKLDFWKNWLSFANTSRASGLAVVHGFMHTFHRCIHLSPLIVKNRNGLLSILISVALNGEDASKLHLKKKNVRSVQLASKWTNLRPGTQKTFGRKNTAKFCIQQEPRQKSADDFASYLPRYVLNSMKRFQMWWQWCICNHTKAYRSCSAVTDSQGLL